MSDASIALNRFGLGARANEEVPGDPRAWLRGQLDRFDPRPEPIAGLPETRVIATELADYLEQARMAQREGGAEPRQNPGQRRTAGYQPPSLSGEAMTGDGAAMREMQDGGAAMSGPAEPVENPRDPLAQARQFARRQAREYYTSAVAARTGVTLDTQAPFVERLVHFWSNHFAVSADKLTVIGIAGMLEFEAIRPHVLGKFADMLGAVERHPAMLLYLDQAQSIGPDSLAGQIAGRRRNPRRLGLNENLAREILELHTLGVRTGYTQSDVTEFARAMTGWTVAGITRGPAARFAGLEGEPGKFVFAPRIHEPGARAILGRQWAEGGEEQAQSVLDHLAAHPSTARHIATKLARHFAADEPSPALVARLEAAFLRSGGDLPTVYRALIDAPECWAPSPAKFKTPWEWGVSALRALGTRQLPPTAMVGLMIQLGQPVWRPGSPAGYDDIAASWAGPDAIMRRVEAAERISQRTQNLIDPRKRAAELFPEALSEPTAQAIARAESPGQGVALMLVAPEFMRR
jgi:uncharacterized protein (DUF1800 family)